MRKKEWLILGLLLALSSLAPAALPLARLNSVFPMGLRAGSSVEVTLEGVDLEGANQLLFSRPGLTAEALGGLRFRVSAPADFPLGAMDVRAVGDWGASNPRAFVIGTLTEQSEAEPNNLIGEAQGLSLDSVTNGVIAARADVDYFKVTLEAGMSVVIDVAAERIDSQLDGVLTLFGPKGEALELSSGYERKDPRIDFVAPVAGEYKIRVHDLTYAGGSGYFYRLSVQRTAIIDQVYPPVIGPGQEAELRAIGRQLPGSQSASTYVNGKGLEEMSFKVTAPTAIDGLEVEAFLDPRQGGSDAFAVRPVPGAPQVLIGIARHALTLETEPNEDVSAPQSIAVPTEIVGRLGKVGDRDVYRFTARKDQPLEIAAISEQAGFPADLAILLRRITGMDSASGKVTVEDVAEYDDNPTSIGGLSYVTSTHDPTALFVPPVDGEYLLEVRDRFAESRGDARFVYRLRVAPPQPDFRLLVTPADMSNPSALLVRAGGTMEATVMVYRQGGFAGPIDLVVEGLAAGVKASATTIGPGMTQTGIVFEAAPDAAASLAMIKVIGVAKIGEQEIRHEARSATILWPAGGNAPRPARLTRSLPLAVRGSAPYRLTAAPVLATIGQGGMLDVEAKLERRVAEYTDKLAGLTAVHLPATAENAAVEIPPGQNGAMLPLYFKPETPAGTYTFFLRGAGNVPFTKTPTDPNAQKQPVEVSDPSLPIRVTVVLQPANIVPASVEPGLKPGQVTSLGLKLERKNGYTGTIRLGLRLPPGMTGIDAPEIVLPPDVQETILPIQVASDVPVGDKGGVTIRGWARLENDLVPIDTRVVLKVAP